ncbi:MAG: dihydropteroate synthase [Pseudomonadota bacterium]
MRIFGIVNVTPDSFSDGGQLQSPQAAIDHALRLEDEGAHVLDIGGESTRPGADPVSADDECRRVLPVIEGLHARTDAALSIDTRKTAVASDALLAGATIWNDVSALRDEGAVELAATSGCGVVLMHMQGDPHSMQQAPRYHDVLAEVMGYLAARITICVNAGCDRARLIADPGIGFGKTLEHNLAIFGDLERFHELGVPLMLGASRKRFISALDRDEPADARLGGSLAAVLRGAQAGAAWCRVHDVKATRQALAVGAPVRPTNRPCKYFIYFFFT